MAHAYDYSHAEQPAQTDKINILKALAEELGKEETREAKILPIRPRVPAPAPKNTPVPLPARGRRARRGEEVYRHNKRMGNLAGLFGAVLVALTLAGALLAYATQRKQEVAITPPPAAVEAPALPKVTERLTGGLPSSAIQPTPVKTISITSMEVVQAQPAPMALVDPIPPRLEAVPAPIQAPVQETAPAVPAPPTAKAPPAPPAPEEPAPAPEPEPVKASKPKPVPAKAAPKPSAKKEPGQQIGTLVVTTPSGKKCYMPRLRPLTGATTISKRMIEVPCAGELIEGVQTVQCKGQLQATTDSVLESNGGSQAFRIGFRRGGACK